MNLSHTLHDIADAKALCSILYSSGNIEIETFGPSGPPPLCYIKLAKILVSRALKRYMFFDYNDVNFNARLSRLK